MVIENWNKFREINLENLNDKIVPKSPTFDLKFGLFAANHVGFIFFI